MPRYAGFAPYRRCHNSKIGASVESLRAASTRCAARCSSGSRPRDRHLVPGHRLRTVAPFHGGDHPRDVHRRRPERGPTMVVSVAHPGGHLRRLVHRLTGGTPVAGPRRRQRRLRQQRPAQRQLPGRTRIEVARRDPLRGGRQHRPCPRRRPRHRSELHRRAGRQNPVPAAAAIARSAASQARPASSSVVSNAAATRYASTTTAPAPPGRRRVPAGRHPVRGQGHPDARDALTAISRIVDNRSRDLTPRSTLSTPLFDLPSPSANVCCDSLRRTRR